MYALIQYSCDFPILGGIAPATLNELVESECGPLLVFRTRPGQELPHRAFIEEKGLGRYVPDKDRLMEILQAGLSPEAKQRFLDRGRAFRDDQARRAAELPSLVKSLYESTHK
ncbi:MAG: hypothetical protein TR69_WS6001000349 [candidate division WS6 bacterium OLB20]|uniref:Uncharacterized protein n=1 Tax=candidate division WS6 bacterium OLB20 TaxID=1617426 RepID=A0A136M0P2_9BACT|nr:MAG: hypothetical protein TR69_WS6001000349 [candidate division WS6 bacterium OLB20]